MMRVQVMRMEPMSTPSKPYCVSTSRGVAVNKYCITWIRMIESPSVIRMLRSNSSGRSLASSTSCIANPTSMTARIAAASAGQ